MLTMLIGGLWHGANWTFVVWGGWQGGMLAMHRLYRPKGSHGMPWILGHPLMLLGVVLGWVVFRADTFTEALRIYTGMLGLHGVGMSGRPRLAGNAGPAVDGGDRHCRGLCAADLPPGRGGDGPGGGRRCR